MITHINPDAILDSSIHSNKLDSSSFKTINSQSILGEGNITIQGDSNVQAVDTSETLDDVETNTYVKYVAQALTDALKLQVRENIGAASSDGVQIDLSDYYTKEEVDNKLGDINTILESIING